MFRRRKMTELAPTAGERLDELARRIEHLETLAGVSADTAQVADPPAPDDSAQVATSVAAPASAAEPTPEHDNPFRRLLRGETAVLAGAHPHDAETAAERPAAIDAQVPAELVDDAPAAVEGGTVPRTSAGDDEHPAAVAD
jgi:hypothetical protein